MKRPFTLLAIAVLTVVGNTAQAQQVSTLAGTGVAGSVDGPAATAQFDQPYGVAADSAGNVYVAEPNTHTIRLITPAGVVSTYAGSGFPGYFNGSAGLGSIFSSPQEVLVAHNGDLLISDSSNGSIRRVDKNTTAVTTVAGDGRGGYADGPVATARFETPIGLALDGVGNLYVADADAFRLRKIAAGVVSTVAGSGVRGYLDGPAANARFWSPTGLATDAAGNVYIADNVGQRVRKFDPTTNTVSTLVGAGVAGYVDGPLAVARVSNPYKLSYNAPEDALYLLDRGNARVRKINLRTATISTVAGSGQVGFTDGPALSARFNLPFGLAQTSSTELLIADTNNHRIRRLSGLVLVTQAPTVQLALAPELWPNPSSDICTLRFYVSQSGATTVRLLDLTGRIVRQLPLLSRLVGWHTVSLPTHNLAVGSYVLQVQSAAGSGACKLLVQH